MKATDLSLSKIYVPCLYLFQEGDGQTPATRLPKKIAREVMQSLHEQITTVKV
ncbi:hypothetical protein [Psychrobacillus glaciei]|uniref:hypothetical protein n=1 Tax=Psychrobacillus glaciei TaxID=2283160 RepID=UPI00178C7364|nr:hypothetical protein [Psychrobacillus glaciei]